MSDPPRRLVWTVGAGDGGVRLDLFLTRKGVLGTRSQVARLIAAGRVLLRGRSGKAGVLLRIGDEVTAEPQPFALLQAEAEPIALEVLYEDDALLAINKPPGMVVHPAPGHQRGTLVSALLHRWASPGEGLDPGRLGIVHRLDKDTSGVLLVARTPDSLAELARQFRVREVRKEYLALVVGAPRESSGTIEAPIGRHPTLRKKMAVRPQGRSARTRYEVLERLNGLTLVRAFPETGRTHQIRVHLAALGTPVACDPLYGRSRTTLSMPLGRQALHARAIEFTHPDTGVRLRIEAPLAGDFARALANLGAKTLTSSRPFHSVSAETQDSERSVGAVRRIRARRPSA